MLILATAYLGHESARINALQQTELNKVCAWARLCRVVRFCGLYMLIFCSVCSTFCLSGLCQEMDFRTQWILFYRQVYVSGITRSNTWRATLRRLFEENYFANVQLALIFRDTYFFPPSSKQFPYFFKQPPYFLSLNTKKKLLANRSHLKPRV